MNRYLLSYSTSLFAFALIMASGCSNKPKLYDIEGVLSYQGDPLSKVDVTFTPVSGGRVSNGRTDENGKFSMWYTGEQKGVEPGEHVVSIAYYPTFAEEKDTKLQNMMKKVVDVYGDPSESTQRVTIDRDALDLNINLE